MNIGEMRKVLSVIESGWPGVLSAETSSLYVEALADLDGPLTLRAVKGLLLTSEFRPTIAAVRSSVLRLGLPSLAEAERQAVLLARYREQRAFVNGSGYEPVEPVVHDAVRQACEGMTLTGLWQRRFRDAYESVTVIDGMLELGS